MTTTRTLTAVAAMAAAGAALHLAPAAVGFPGLTAAVTRAMRPLPPGAVLLTFDDGPHPLGTPAVLDRLASHGVRALFFLVGEQVVARPALARRIVDEGHEIGVHGWDHRPEARCSPAALTRGVARTVIAVADACGRAPRWYRPPYGVTTGTSLIAARRAGLAPLWWTRWGRDWSPRATDSSIAARLMGGPRTARTGQILLLHDSDRYGTPGSWRRTAAALDRVLDAVPARGQFFVTAGALRAGRRGDWPHTPAPR